MFRKLGFRIWILFGIWVLEFGILVSHPEKKSLLAKSAGADLDVTPLFLPSLLTALGKKS
jgi:hypothetical protein